MCRLVAFALGSKCFSIDSKDFLNLVLVGDSGIGKTAMVCVLKDGKRPDQEIPEFLQSFSQKMKVDGKKLELGLWDTSGKTMYEGLRRLAYPNCHAFIVCYSVNSRESFENVTKVWLPEIHRHGSPNALVFIVGTKQDLRKRPSLIPNGSTPASEEQFVNFDEGLKLANDQQAGGFLECTVHNESSVINVFEHAARIVRQNAKELKKKDKGRRDSNGK